MAGCWCTYAPQSCHSDFPDGQHTHRSYFILLRGNFCVVIWWVSIFYLWDADGLMKYNRSMGGFQMEAKSFDIKFQRSVRNFAGAPPQPLSSTRGRRIPGPKPPKNCEKFRTNSKHEISHMDKLPPSLHSLGPTRTQLCEKLPRAQER